MAIVIHKLVKSSLNTLFDDIMYFSFVINTVYELGIHLIFLGLQMITIRIMALIILVCSRNDM